MRTKTVFVAEDGKEFESEFECRAYEAGTAFQKLNRFMLGYDSDGKPIRWGDQSQDAAIVHVKAYPTDEELQDPIIDEGWATLFPDEVTDAVRNLRRFGWYICDPISEWWIHIEDYRQAIKQVEAGLRVAQSIEDSLF